VDLELGVDEALHRREVVEHAVVDAVARPWPRGRGTRLRAGRRTPCSPSRCRGGRPAGACPPWAQRTSQRPFPSGASTRAAASARTCTRSGVHEAVEAVAADHRVAVEVGQALPLDLRRVVLDPLRAAEQPELLAVPRRVADREPRPPAALVQRAEHGHRLERRGRARARVDRSVHPGVAVVADHHVAAVRVGAGERAVHVPDRTDRLVELDLEAHADRARARGGRRRGTSPATPSARASRAAARRSARRCAPRSAARGCGQARRLRSRQARASLSAGVPGVSGSPTFCEMNCTEPRCSALSGRHGPSGHTSPWRQPSSSGRSRSGRRTRRRARPPAP
jgi:hypothetical protein